MKQPAVYFMANYRNGAVYTGVTSDLLKRIYQHRAGHIRGFTADHGAKKLVWYEMHQNMEAAIKREKQLKNCKRLWKLALLEENNPRWFDLAKGLSFKPL